MKQNLSAGTVIIVLIVVIAIVGLVGWKVMTAKKATTTDEPIPMPGPEEMQKDMQQGPAGDTGGVGQESQPIDR